MVRRGAKHAQAGEPMADESVRTGTDAGQAMSGDCELDGSRTVTKTCRHCGAEVPAEARSCPQCGDKQYRKCFCGSVFAAGLKRCPECGMDWAKSTRIRRRGHHDKVRASDMIRPALMGAAVALLGFGLLNTIVSALALHATPEAVVPPGMGQRLAYAWLTTRLYLTSLTASLVGGPGVALVIALIGGLSGAAVHWRSARLGRHKRSSRGGRRRRRRSENQ